LTLVTMYLHTYILDTKIDIPVYNSYITYMYALKTLSTAIS
jgi:hypothetical protein